MEETTDNKVLLSPDYDDDLEDDDDIDFDDLEDEGANETLLDSFLKEETQKEKEEKPVASPFVNNTPNWNNGGNSGVSNFWNKDTFQPYAYPQPQQKQNTGPNWGNFSQPSGTIWGQQNNRQGNNDIVIDRNKDIIVCDFLDVIAQTCESDGKPGLLPRDIYDLIPRLNVWSMIKAFNPRYVYGLFPNNLIPNTNGAHGWKVTLNYYCCSLSAFLRLPFENCQMLVQSKIGQSKEELIMNAIMELQLDKRKMLYIGIYSGIYYGQSNEDALAAERCGIDYMDLNQLLK